MIFIGYAGWNAFSFQAMPGMIVHESKQKKEEMKLEMKVKSGVDG